MGMSIEESDNGTKQRTIEEFKEIPKELEETIAQELDDIWQKIYNLAIELCPKDTGALASSIELESEGGSGVIGVSGISGDFYTGSIYAGNDEIINPKSGRATSEYALFVHDGHAIGDMFYEGVAFLADAVAAYQTELDAAVDRAMNEMRINKEGT